MQKISLQRNKNKPFPAGGFRELLTLAYPVMISMLSQSFMGTVDTFLMGWVGTPEQGAVGLGSTITWSTICMVYGTLTVITTFVSQRLGAKNYEQCGNYAWQGFYFGITYFMFLLLLIIPNLNSLLAIIGPDPGLVDLTSRYMEIRLQGSLFVFTNFCVISFFRGIGNTKTPMKITLFINLINIVLSYILVFGKLGIPPLGLMGAAVGSVMSTAIGSAIYLSIFLGAHYRKKYHTDKISLDLNKTISFLKIGIPVGISWLMEMIIWAAFAGMVAKLGAKQLAAHNIVMQLVQLSFLPGVAISVANSTLVGQYIGAKKPKIAVKCGYTATKTGVAYMACMGITFLLLREQLPFVFNRDPEVIAISSQIILFAAGFQVFDALFVTSIGVLRGAGDTRWCMVVTILLSWLFFLPLLYLLTFYFNFGISGAWCAALIYITVLGLTMFARFYGGKWQKIKI